MKYLIGMYSPTVVLALIYFNIWGDNSHKSFFYNLGEAIIWPCVAFPALGQVVGAIVLLGVILFLTSRR